MTTAALRNLSRRRTHGRPQLLMLVVWFCIISILVASYFAYPLSANARSLLMLIAGVATMGVLDSANRIIASRRLHGLDKPELNTDSLSFVSNRLRLELTDREERLERRALFEGEPPDPEFIVNWDPVLALALLRLAIEVKLRRKAGDIELDCDSRLAPIEQIVEGLASKDNLAARLMPSLRDLLGICNQAIHGAVVSEKNAEETIRAGRRILQVLDGVQRSSNAL